MIVDSIVAQRGRLETDARWGKAEINMGSISFSEPRIIFPAKGQ